MDREDILKRVFEDHSDEYEMDYEFTGDDGEMANGYLYYKVVNGEVDPNSLRGESEYNGNHKVDDEFATYMVKPGGPEHEEALEAARDDYKYEADRMRSKFGEETNEGDDKYDHEADMARSQLMRTAEKAVALFKMIKPGDNLEGWTASKITKAADYLDSVHNYMSYEMLKAQEKEKMNSIVHSEDDYHSTLESKLSKEIDNGKM